MPFCPTCGNETQQSHQFCGSCGATLGETQPERVATAQLPQHVSGDLPYYLSPRRILCMSVLTYGFYLVYWFYITWKQYRDHTGNEAFPVWHALTLLVPIYGLFRTHAHMRTYKELMEQTDVPTTINPAWAVALVFVTGFLDGVSFNLAGGLSTLPEMTLALALGLAALNFISIAIVTGLLLHIQGNLNAYWQRITSGWTGAGNRELTSARVGVGEVILGIVGALIWMDTLATLLSPSYRMLGTS